MNSFLDRVIWNNTVESYLWTTGIVLFVLLLNRIISRYLAALLYRAFHGLLKNYDKQKFSDLIVNPLGIFLVITVCIVAFYQLHYPDAFKFTLYKYSLQQILLSLAIAVQVLAFTWLLLRVIDFIASILQVKANATPSQSDNQLIVFFRDFIKVVVGVLGLIVMLNKAFDYNVSTLLTGLSIVGAAVALALRESLENLIASFVIFFDKPFHIGDTVKVQNVTGVVERIGLRSTRIRSEQKTYVTVPNKQMVDTILDNISQRTQQRNELLLQISLNTPSQKIEAVMEELRRFLSGIKEIEVYNVLFLDINVQAYTIQVEYFVPAAYLSQFNSLRQKVNLFALQLLEREGLKIAGSGKDVVMK
ncbi:mechanosensitive ion channel family protein [Flavisolibacter ginsenosidimutans]|uniref:Mechanosensitive ion channel n=1 Tax=Flavisolibacter ginsenosidimutans TaxID=661481 RepID=A0A5B8UK22_9BACT|nr:mechanosensitive ion channel domain-containing protein [Flavisolibacter ginsenosidimutans]QEC56776.1 mechanosensitive ion channel [Flavisolibacter ginsenosidimutans]